MKWGGRQRGNVRRDFSRHICGRDATSISCAEASGEALFLQCTGGPHPLQ